MDFNPIGSTQSKIEDIKVAKDELAPLPSLNSLQMGFYKRNCLKKNIKLQFGKKNLRSLGLR
jgi:hypothetical protein